MLNEFRNRIFKCYPIKDRTFFKIGGNIDTLLYPEGVDDICAFVREMGAKNFITLGECSNVLIRDGGVREPVILMRNMKGVKYNDGLIIAEAGCKNSYVSSYARENALGGLEFLSGIPGSVGGGIKMNAGCFGSEFKDVVGYVRFVDQECVEHCVLGNEINFGYRHSDMPDNVVITEVALKTFHKDKELISADIKEILKQKHESQQYGNTCGCVFKNGDGYFAGALIDQAGLKGRRIGGAYISEKHANFIINDRNATSKDIESLIELVVNEVEQRFGISLSLELKIFGEDSL